MVQCPGQDQRFWKPEDIFEIDCPDCKKPVEFFKDDPKLKCRNCGQIVANPKIDLGCAKWCQYADKCLAVAVVNEANVIQKRLIRDMMNVFEDDQKRIDHAMAVLDYSERIISVEGGDPLVVKSAAILHDIGIKEAEQKYNSSAAKYQEIEGPPIAREILLKYEVDQAIVEHVCRIIANHHSAKDIDTLEFRIIWDSDWLVNIPVEFPDAGTEKMQELIDRIFKTSKGRQIAIELFLENKTEISQ
jgi:putative nucleotidyltransferase with HDIG domain